MTYSQRLVNAINDYVSMRGCGTIMDSHEIFVIAGLLKQYGNIHASDYCYNRYNYWLKDFNGPFLFEYIGFNQYRVLGEHYPYSGIIIHKPRHRSEVVVGRWENGSKVLYKDVIDSLRQTKND